MDFDLFNKSHPEHLIHDDYLATQRAKRNARIGKTLGIIMAAVLARYLWS